MSNEVKIIKCKITKSIRQKRQLLDQLNQKVVALQNEHFAEANALKGLGFALGCIDNPDTNCDIGNQE